MGSFNRKRLGDILVEAGAITEKQLQEAMTEQVSSEKRMSQLLIEKEFITEEKLVEILEEQLGIPQVNLYNYNIDPEVVTTIPLYLAKRHLVVPIEINDKKLKLAMADPVNIIAVDDVAMVTGMEVTPVIASESAIMHTIEQVFSLAESVEQDTVFGKSASNEEEIAKLKALVEEAPIVKVVNSLIHQAVNEGASDIHIEPSGKGVRVRMRIDGILHDLMTPPKDTQPLIVSRIKIMSNLDIAEKRLPQDGRITIQVGLKDVNMRVSTMPTIHGEKVVIRILDKEKVILPLDKLGFTDKNYQTFMNFLLNHTGMILVTGPTGSGKTTTLYSALNYMNKAEDNIITVEDPVEYRLDGINQVQVNPRINLTFAGALRTILRQDPNVVMIGEIRDLETAEMATRAALTGHLVLSTLHTNDASSTVSRLLDMGVDGYLVSSSLVGVIAQRLVRRICRHCREQYGLSMQEQALFRNTFRKEPPAALTRGKGCRQCNQTGYRGRFAIHEMLQLNKEIHALILERAAPERIRQAAINQGMDTLLKDGLRRIEEGETSLEEVVRVAYSGKESEELAESAPASAPPAASVQPSAQQTVSPAPVAQASAEGITPAQTAAPTPVSAPAQAAAPKTAAPTPVPPPAAKPALSVDPGGNLTACEGETVTCSYTVSNTGDVPLAGVTIADSLQGSTWRHSFGEIMPGQTVDYSAEATIPAATNQDKLESEITVTGSFRDTSVLAEGRRTIDIARPSLTIEKSTPPRAETGETIECQFIVTNTGNVPLSEVTVRDPLLGDSWQYTIGELPVGGVSNFSEEAVLPDNLSGKVNEKAVVSGRYGARELTAAGGCAIEIGSRGKPGVAMEITAPESARIGDTVTYRFTISNNGEDDLTGVKVTAPLFGKFWCNTIGNLAAGKTVKFSFSYTVPEGQQSELLNTARVSGRSGAAEVTAEASHSIKIQARSVS